MTAGEKLRRVARTFSREPAVLGAVLLIAVTAGATVQNA